MRYRLVVAALAVMVLLAIGLVQLLSGSQWLASMKTSLGDAFSGMKNSIASGGGDKTAADNDKTIHAIVRVNGDIITNYDLLVRQRIYFLENNLTESSATLQQTREAVLKSLILERLQDQFANQSGAPNYIAEAQQQLERVAQQNRQTRAQTLEMMAKRGIAEKDIVGYIATTIRWQSILYGLINQSNVVTPVDINEQLKKKKAMVGKNIYQTIQLDVKRPDKDYLQQVINILQKNPAGWQKELASDLQSGRISITQRTDMTAQQFGEPFTTQLLQQKAAIPPGSIMGPKYTSNNQKAIIYILLGGGVVPAMELNELKDSIAVEFKDRAMQPLDAQMKDKLWREAVIEKL